MLLGIHLRQRSCLISITTTNMRELFLGLENLKEGLHALEDTTKAKLGAALKMRNCVVTDRGGIGPRPGTILLGTYDSTRTPTTGFFNFKKSFGNDEILMRSYGTVMYFLSKKYKTKGWTFLKGDFTNGAEFGFVPSLVNTENNDYVIFCNRYENYQRWSGALAQLTSSLVGGETTITVDSIITDDIYYSGTATSASATTIDVSTAPWAADQWKNFYVHITSGTHINKIRKITAVTTTQITFDTLTITPGTCTFEICQTKFPASGTIIYNGNSLAYSAIPEYNKFTVGSALASATSSDLVTIAPEEYSSNPRGNRLTNYLNRIIVGNVRSALARNTGGALQGYSSAGSYFVSKVNTPTDFSFAAARVAGEGDIVSTPYGGGDITDVTHQESDAYIFKKNYIESVSYSQDANDLAVRTPLKQNVGSIGKVIKGSDDVYFITEDKKLTSLGRVKTKDLLPSTENLGYPIKRFLEQCDFSTLGKGIEYNDKIYIPIKSSSSETYNNIFLVFNKKNKSFDGIWDLPGFGLETFDDGLYFSESNGTNVYKMLDGVTDIVGENRYPVSAEYQTHFFNLTAQKTGFQAINGVTFEGYIKGGTTITFNVFKDMATTPFFTFNFSADETGLLDGEESSAFLGGSPLAVGPFASTFSEPDADGRRHFQFQIYFPFQYGNFFSIGHSSSGADFDYEMTRFGLLMKEEFSPQNSKIKTL